MSNIFQKMFSSWGLGTRIPLRTNVFGKGGKGAVQEKREFSSE